ncbi:uncharacterized protein M437DRAFT_86868 [Aureobasidium melanogenum CBS 110374]|uniref:Uncharacterized protein n=1 Tax=Aureobasidium melanogenum (strain CBS 110374) TaxID=1043003 RepID=A0A074VRR7_AURM1|nr:uncharacterized protein M437DRAFT_86868 [Aureobasidium melanogenum CBS 110374]KEQ60407.1 hypothetical protein M437DRAFT_86868 [Aureobasidium melanogenum CBS 110374]
MSEDLERTVAGTHNVAIDSDALTLKQEMHLAVQSYNQKSKESNLRLLRDCVNAISTLNLTEQEKLNRIAQILFRSEDWGQNEDFSNQPESAPKQVGDYGWPPERLEQVLGLPQLQRNCYRLPYSEKFSTMLVEEMIKVVFKGREEHKVVVPQELIAFFGFVSGVLSLDYDRRGLCPFEAPIKEVVSKASRDHLVCDDGCLFNLVHEDVEQETLVREQMREILDGRNKAPKATVKNFNDTWADLFEMDVLSRLDVLGGFQFGWSIGICKYEPVEWWHSYYLFCRHKADQDNADDTKKTQDDKDEAEWAWRVVIHLESDFDDGIVHPTRIFDSIFEFLNWYGDWYNRLDLEDFLEKLVEDYEFGE